MSNKDYLILRKTGRLTNGNERGHGVVYHAVKNSRALCGTTHGKLSCWSENEGEHVTCERCLKKISEQSKQALCCKQTLEYCLDKCENLDDSDFPNLWCNSLDEFIN